MISRLGAERPQLFVLGYVKLREGVQYFEGSLPTL